MSQGKVCPQCGSEYELDQRFCPKDGSTLRSAGGAKDLVGQVIADRYHVMKKLGEGGMGQVYLAEHVKMGRRSAVKVMHQTMHADADAVSRFNREASNAARISHPNVCAIYDFGETSDGLIYLAMEFIEGQPLTDVAAEAGSLPPVRAGEIVRQVAAALDVAHDFGIVHRDLKPDNIMVTRTRDGADLVKVVDFGIAKASNNESQKVTKTGLVVGTPDYMSPEQLAGDTLDGRSDVYSLGLVAYHCLTGRLPFIAETAQETMILRLTDAPATLASAKPEVAWPAELQAVMDRVLARDARDRYATAGEFARDFVRQAGRVPQASAADAGTQVVGAVSAGAADGATAMLPSTRVASASEKRRAEVGTPEGTPPSARPTQGKSPVALVGAALVGVAILGGAWALFGRPGSPATPSTGPAPAPASAPATGPALATSTNPPASVTAPGATAPAPNAGAPGGSAVPSPASGSVTRPPGGKTGGSAAPAAAREDVNAALDRLEGKIRTEEKDKAKEALGELERLEAPPGKPAVRRNYLRAEAHYVLGDDPRVCAILKDLKPRAGEVGMARDVDGLWVYAKCQ